MKRKFAPKEASEAVVRVAGRRGAALKVATAAVGLGVATAAAIARSNVGRTQKAVVKYLQAQLGSRTTAYLSGADDAQVVDLWMQGEARPDRLHWKRLQSAYDATRVLVEAYDDQTTRSWFVGMNPTLDNDSPARVLRNSRNPRVWSDVVLAAREFAES
jgi:hypothetical protein